MKRSIGLLVTLLHIMCNADYVTSQLAEQLWNPIVLDNAAKIDHQATNSAHTVYVPHPVTFSTQHKYFPSSLSSFAHRASADGSASVFACGYVGLSPSGLRRHHIFSPPSYNLSHMNTEQLVRYFYANNYTEGEVLSNPMLYMNQAYLAIAKQLPRYSEFVEKYHKKYRTYKGFFKFWETIHFRYRKGLKKQFAHLYQECEKERVAKEARERKDREERAAQERAAQVIKEAQAHGSYIRELERVENIINDGTACKRLSIKNHKVRLEKIKVSQQRPERKLRQLQTGQEALNFIAAYGITEQQVTRIMLNSYEYQLHKEFVSHIHSTLALQRKHNITDPNLFIDALGSSIAIGIKSNHLHNPEWATRWSDFCYEAIEIIRGIGEGIVLGSYNTVDMVVMHPVRTLVRMVDGVRMLGSLTARTVGTLAHWNYLIEHGECLQCVTEMAAVGEQLTTMAAGIKEATSQMSNREITKHVTAFGTEWVLTGQMFAMGHTLCSNLGHTIKRTIKFLKDEGAAGEFALATTDGVLLKASENMQKGGGSSNLVRDSRVVLEAVHKQYMIMLETELESLRLLCDNRVLDAANFGNKYLKPQYKHILGMELELSRRGIPQIGGFHHDRMHIIENSGVFRFVDKVAHEFGFYSAELYYGENFVKSITFFPADWSRKQVIETIYEAYTNFVKSGMKPVLESNGKYRVDAVLNRQIKIRMYITKDAVIKTAYPILE